MIFLVGLSIFHLRELPGRIFVTEVFVERVREHGLNGFEFIKAWPMPEGTNYHDEHLKSLKQSKSHLVPTERGLQQVKREAIMIEFGLTTKRILPTEKKLLAKYRSQLDAQLLVRNLDDNYFGYLEAVSASSALNNGADSRIKNFTLESNPAIASRHDTRSLPFQSATSGSACGSRRTTPTSVTPNANTKTSKLIQRLGANSPLIWKKKVAATSRSHFFVPRVGWSKKSPQEPAIKLPVTGRRGSASQDTIPESYSIRQTPNSFSLIRADTASNSMPLLARRSHWIFTGPVIAILFGHYIVDTYSSVIPPLIGVVQTEFDMRPQWAAVLLGVGSIFSGLSQPLFAWVSDKTGSRIFGPLGILMAALAIGMIGYSPNINVLFAVYATGMVGIGMFHPIATARIGAIAGDQRSFAISLFFVFGMAGFFTGSLLGPALTTEGGTLRNLAYLIPAGLLIAITLQWNINKSNGGRNARPVKKSIAMSSYDWYSISLLFLSAVFRFFVNMAVVYLIVRWAEAHVAAQHPAWSQDEVADHSASIAGVAQAWMFVGQGVSGLLAGIVIRNGMEKIPLMLTPILFAPFIVLLAFVPPGLSGHASCFLAGVGFAAMTPITISVGQRLMPGHTRLASGLMLGGAWVFASLGPRTAELLIDRFSLTSSIITTGVVLCFAGLAASGINNRAIRRNTGRESG